LTPLPEAGRDLDTARLARRAALWAGGVLLLLALALPAFGGRKLGHSLARLDPPLVLGLLGLSLANYALRSLRWHLLSRAAGLRVPFLRNSLYYVAGFAFTVTPGKAGEVVRLWLLRRHHGVPYRRTLGLVAVDRLADAVPLLALCLPGATAFAGQGRSVAAVAAVVLGGSVLALRPGWLAALVKFAYGRLRVRPRSFAAVLRALRSLRALVVPPVLLTALGLGLVGWSAEVLASWLVLHRLGVEISLPAAAAVFGFGMLVGGLPLFPGGVGGAEGAMIGLLVLLGVGLGTAATATAIIRATTLGFALVLGFLVLPLAAWRRSGGSRTGNALSSRSLPERRTNFHEARP
jgi:glycosyltransferase 2 family protein